MGTVFISSVIGGFEEQRQAVKEDVELMDYQPVMSESFGARPYSPETACIHEVEQSEVHLLILGANYGFETAATHGQRDIDDDRLSNPIEAISTKSLGQDDDVEPDTIGDTFKNPKFRLGGRLAAHASTAWSPTPCGTMTDSSGQTTTYLTDFPQE